MCCFYSWFHLLWEATDHKKWLNPSHVAGTVIGSLILLWRRQDFAFRNEPVIHASVMCIGNKDFLKTPRQHGIILIITHHIDRFMCIEKCEIQDDVIKWKYFSRYWHFKRGNHRSMVDSPHKGQQCGALVFSVIFAWTNSWVNNRDAGYFVRHSAHYDVTVMQAKSSMENFSREFISWQFLPSKIIQTREWKTHPYG